MIYSGAKACKADLQSYSYRVRKDLTWQRQQTDVEEDRQASKKLDRLTGKKTHSYSYSKQETDWLIKATGRQGGRQKPDRQNNSQPGGKTFSAVLECDNRVKFVNVTGVMHCFVVTIIIWRALKCVSHPVSIRVREKAHPTSTLTLSMLLCCGFCLLLPMTHLLAAVFSLLRQHRKDQTVIYERSANTSPTHVTTCKLTMWLILKLVYIFKKYILKTINTGVASI